MSAMKGQFNKFVIVAHAFVMNYLYKKLKKKLVEIYFGLYLHP